MLPTSVHHGLVNEFKHLCPWLRLKSPSISEGFIPEETPDLCENKSDIQTHHCLCVGWWNVDWQNPVWLNGEQAQLVTGTLKIIFVNSDKACLIGNVQYCWEMSRDLTRHNQALTLRRGGGGAGKYSVSTKILAAPTTNLRNTKEKHADQKWSAVKTTPRSWSMKRKAQLRWAESRSSQRHIHKNCCYHCSSRATGKRTP